MYVVIVTELITELIETFLIDVRRSVAFVRGMKTEICSRAS